MDYGESLAQRIDNLYAHEEGEDGMRKHLGASVIGEKCLRQIWYSFHWTDSEPFDGRMLRLFSRGQREEEVFTELLRRAGATVWTKDAQGQQFRLSALGGHFGGSIDGVAVDLPDLPSYVLPGSPVLLEMKTHNDKRFNELKKKGLQEAHPKHWKQAQVYMHALRLPYGLYCAVNKNDDSLWFHFFAQDPKVGEYMLNRAETVIFGTGIPPRISESPTWFECRFCPMHGVCFRTKMPRVNCRTCVHSRAERDGSWSCAKGEPAIVDHPKQGCHSHEYKPDFFR